MDDFVFPILNSQLHHQAIQSVKVSEFNPNCNNMNSHSKDSVDTPHKNRPAIGFVWL